MESILFTPIGVIHSPFTSPKDMPIQPAGARGVRGQAELLPEFAPGLADVEGFSHIYILYNFHRSTGFDLSVTPFMDDTPRGLFSTRAPRRPNPLGLSIVRLERVEGHVLHLLDVDVLDGTPLLDVKPYAAAFDSVRDARCGWLEGKDEQVTDARSDSRFSRN